MDLSEIIQASAAVLTAMALVSNVALVYLAWRSAELHHATARTQALIARKSLLLQANAMALQDEQTLAASMRVQFPEQGPEADSRDRFIAFNLLNCAEVAWMTAVLDHDSRDAASEACRHFVTRLLKSEGNWPLLLDGGYSAGFVEFCQHASPRFNAFAREVRQASLGKD